MRACQTKQRGQAASLDLILAAVVAVIVVSYLVSFFSIQASSAKGETFRWRLASSGASTIDFLVSSRGIPENWAANHSGAAAIGLASEPHSLSHSKLANFTSLDYQTAKSMLSIEDEFYFWVENATDNSTLYSTGQNNASNLSYVFTRYSTLGGTPVRAKLKVYSHGG